MTGSASEGQPLYEANCSSCHGMDLDGIQGAGKNLILSEFVAQQTNAELLAFIKRGRPIWDAKNTSGADMPPRGGNPSLSDQDIVHIVIYIREVR